MYPVRYFTSCRASCICASPLTSDPQFVYFFCGTSFNSAFHAYAPKDAIIEGFSDALVDRILSAQRKKIAANLRLYEKFSEHEDEEALNKMVNPYVHVMFDDTASDPATYHSESLKVLAMNGRHYRSGTWISTQHGHALHPGKSTQPRPNRIYA